MIDVDYWAGLMDRDIIPINDLVKDISEAANGNDGGAFNGKVAAASLFAARVGKPNEIHAYWGNAEKIISIERIVNAHGATPENVGLVGAAPVSEVLPGF